MRRAGLSVVLPTYNERDRLTELVDSIFAAWDDAAAHAFGPIDVIVVDDNSPDGTGAHADVLARDHRMRVIHRPEKMGLASAVLDGFAIARGEIVAVMDADLSHPPHLLVQMCETLDRTGADICVGSRYVSGGGTDDWSLWRLTLSHIACWLARPLTSVHDATSGFLVARREHVQDVRSGTRGFKIGLELLVRSAPCSVCEVPYVFVGRTAGKSKMGPRECVRYLRQLANLYWYQLTQGIRASGNSVAFRKARARKPAPRPQEP